MQQSDESTSKNYSLKFLIAILTFFLMLLMFGGILLNHAEELSLKDLRIQSAQLERWYPSQRLEILGSEVDGHWYYPFQGYIYKDNLPWQQCNGTFIAAIKLDQFLVLACSKELLWFDKFERLVDRINEDYGLPPNIQSVGFISHQLFIRNQAKVFNIDLSSMELFEAVTAKNIKWIGKQLIPTELIEQFAEEQSVDLKTIVHDIYHWLFAREQSKLFIDMCLVFFATLLLGWARFLFLKLSPVQPQEDLY